MEEELLKAAKIVELCADSGSEVVATLDVVSKGVHCKACVSYKGNGLVSYYTTNPIRTIYETSNPCKAEDVLLHINGSIEEVDLTFDKKSHLTYPKVKSGKSYSIRTPFVHAFNDSDDTKSGRICTSHYANTMCERAALVTSVTVPKSSDNEVRKVLPTWYPGEQSDNLAASVMVSNPSSFSQHELDHPDSLCQEMSNM